MRTGVAWVILILEGCSKPPGTNLQFSSPRQLEVADEDQVSRWVDAQGALEIWTLSVSFPGAPIGLRHLTRIRGLRHLSLSGFGNSNPVGNDGNDFRFAVAMSDEDVGLLAKIRTLESLSLWYGRFSDQQRAFLQSRLPACRLSENLNKL